MTSRARVQALTEGVSVKLPENIRALAFKADIEHQRVMLPLFIEFQVVQAQITRAKYLELVKSGFTKDEALALCK